MLARMSAPDPIAATGARRHRASKDSCYHCGLPVPGGGPWRGTILGESREFCCAGCQAVAGAIAESGLEDYYRLRTESAPAPAPEDAEADRIYDRPETQAAFARDVGALREASLFLEGVRCPACLWLNEERLRTLPGVAEAAASYAGQSVRVRWDPARLALSEILAAVRGIGYRARPIDPRHRAGIEAEARRRDAARLVFAGMVGMMVMNLALASYLIGGPDAAGRLPLWEVFGRWGSLVAAAALLAYPGQDFFAGAWRDIRLGRAGMDVPIALGLATAWAGSTWATVRGSGPVYYDAIGMLVFFVLLARAFETRARLEAAATFDRYAVVRPATARRLEDGGGESEVAAGDLSTGDRIRVLPGEIVPADGVLLEEAVLDEAVLTGEPWPRRRGPGEPVAAGSRVTGRPALLRVTATEAASTLGEIRRLLERGLAGRPRFVEIADRLAARLVVVVLLSSAATAALWLARDPARALSATVAVLIVTCPCALALATPVALAITAGRFAKIGVVSARAGGLERLASADTAVFDKTGTLTTATPRLEGVETAGGLDCEGALAVAAALEADTPHPAGRALLAAAGSPPEPARDTQQLPGRGVEGTVSGARWWIGSPEFALGPAALPAAFGESLSRARAEGRLAALLSDRAGRAALFTFAEELRPGAGEIVAELRRAGVARTAVLSGDASAPVERIGSLLGFDEALGAMRMDDKLAWIRTREGSGARILFVGDGLNDAPTLAAARTSVSFAEAPQLSKLASDFLILGHDLQCLAAARRIARRSRRVLAQNLGWALAYNLLAVPLAAAGLVPPWAAALGMSVSSLVVVANALRLARPAAGEQRHPSPGGGGGQGEGASTLSASHGARG
jgi:Cu2+-exporting ATPase